MSDQSPPPKPKPGSLRDRIAAFENKGSTPAPPPPRPKPGGLSQWKPKPPSPPMSPDNVQLADRKPTNNAGMSAADAMESIGRAGSLKERMAALQGKGALGGPPPPPIAPKPTMDKPKWKPSVPASSEVDPDASGREASRSPPPRAVSSPSLEEQGEANRDSETIAREADGGDPDPEEEERQRRAAIAARMARLGGARLGMGPPIFAPKPVVRKSEPPPPALEVQDDDVHGDQLTVVEESNQDLVTSPPPDPLAPAPEAVAEIEHKDDPESPPPVPVRISASMPVPVGPRRAAPPRKKATKNAPTTALPEPPVEEAEDVGIHSPPLPDEPPTSADLATYDPSLVIAESQEELVKMAVAVEAAHHEGLDIKTDTENPLPPTHAETFHEYIVEPAKQEAQEVHVDSHFKEHTAAEEHNVPLEQAQVAIEAGAAEEVRRQRFAAKLAQMGAFNPLAGPPPVPSHESLNEPVLAASEAPLGVEDEVNVDTEEYGEIIPPPPVALASHDTVHSVKHDTAEPHVKPDPHIAKVGEDNRVPAHRDGEHAVMLHTEEQGDGHELPLAVFSEGVHYDLVHVAAVQEPIAASTLEAAVFDVSGTIPIGADAHDQLLVYRGDTDAPFAHSATAELEHDKSNDGALAEEMPPPRINRPVPPPPVNLRSKPTPPSSPPISPPPRAPVQALRVEEIECPPSPDIPPRPIPPPGRSGSMAEDVPPRRSMPPPPRRTSVRMTEPVVDTPSSPPPVPTSPRPISRRPETPQIITTLVTQEQEPEAQQDEQEVYVAEEATPENVTTRPDVPEDEVSARRRAIAERMAKLGGIRFGGPPPPMNSLSRPPLPAAPPPTSIPPDDVDDEEVGPREEEEEDEAARKQRIAAKLAGMGGMRLGMLPPAAGLPPPTARRPSGRQEESESEDTVLPVPIPAPPQRPPPTRKAPPSTEVSEGGGVRTEAEESEIEHVHHADAPVVLSDDDSVSRSARSPEALPTPPPRMTSRSPPPGRPPIPIIPLMRRRTSGTASVSSSRQVSLDEPSARQSEYVLVDADGPDDPSTSPPPRRRGGPTRTIPALPPVPPPSAIDPPEALSFPGSTGWELPTIPQGPEFSEEVASSWSEDSTAVAAARSSNKSVRAGVVGQASTTSVSASVSASGSGGRSVDLSQQQQAPLTPEALAALAHTTGTRIAQAASVLFEKSKRALVGDGSHVGFVRTVLAQVPGAACPAEGAHDSGDGWGHVVYAQTGSAVQRRVSDISPGDVIAFWDAKLKGHKGLQTYTQTVGEGGTPLVGVVSEVEAKKSKVRVWQANQHVGQQNGALTPRATQTVEIVSYRLEDLKSGQVKVYRVLEA